MLLPWLHKPKKSMENRVKGQFDYCPLLWMFSARAVKHKLKIPHERGLIALLNNETSAFNDMLSKSHEATIHVKNIQN